MPPSQGAPTATPTRSVALMLLSVALFAVNALIVKSVAAAYPQADGWVASLFRGVVGLAVAFALYGGARGLQVRRLFSSKLIVLRGIVGGVAIVIFYVTIVRLGAARAVILNLTYPVFGSLIAAVWLKEKLSRAALAWMFVGLVGLAVFLSDEGKLLSPSLYDGLAILGAAMAGWVIVIIRRLRHEEHASTIFASQALYTLLLASPCVGKLAYFPTTAWPVWTGLSVAGVVVAIAQLEMTKAYQKMSVAKGSSLHMLLPVMTGLGAFFCFGESFHLTELLGAAITLLATWRVVTGK